MVPTVGVLVAGAAGLLVLGAGAASADPLFNDGTPLNAGLTTSNDLFSTSGTDALSVDPTVVAGVNAFSGETTGDVAFAIDDDVTLTPFIPTTSGLSPTPGGADHPDTSDLSPLPDPTLLPDSTSSPAAGDTAVSERPVAAVGEDEAVAAGSDAVDSTGSLGNRGSAVAPDLAVTDPGTTPIAFDAAVQPQAPLVMPADETDLPVLTNAVGHPHPHPTHPQNPTHPTTRRTPTRMARTSRNGNGIVRQRPHHPAPPRRRPESSPSA